MRFGHIELFVRDAQDSKRFYVETLGAEVVSEQAESRIVWVRLGEIELLLRPGSPPDGGQGYTDARSAIVLYTPDLEEATEDLRARGLEFRGDDGPDCPTFTDPDGNWFQLVEPSKH